jgi:hypothetical protein
VSRSRRVMLSGGRSRARARLLAWLEGGCPPRNKPKKKSSRCAPVSRSSPLRRRTVGLRLSQGNGREEEEDRSGVRIAEAEPNRGEAGDGENRAKGRGRGEMGGRGAVGRCGFRPRGQRKRCKGKRRE